MRTILRILVDALDDFAANGLQVSQSQFDGVTQASDFAKVAFSAIA
jgi:hypothetical protein